MYEFLEGMQRIHAMLSSAHPAYITARKDHIQRSIVTSVLNDRMEGLKRHDPWLGLQGLRGQLINRTTLEEACTRLRMMLALHSAPAYARPSRWTRSHLIHNLLGRKAENRHI